MKKVLGILSGNMLLAFAISAFVIPNDLIATGGTGFALIVRNFVDLDLSLIVAAVNCVAFLAGLLALGKKFAATTLMSTVLYPFFLNVFQRVEALSHLTEDMMLAIICAGLFMGAGIGLVLRNSASTGGFDIPAVILNRKKGISMAATILVLDMVIILGQAFFSQPEKVLYGIVCALLVSVVINRMTIIGSNETQVVIISEQYEEINHLIHDEIDRGSTLLHIQTGHKGLEQKAVLCVLSNRELPALNERVLQIDPNAFMIINHVNQVNGRGFTLDKHSV